MKQIRLNSKFYSKDAIASAADTFKEVCLCTISGEGFDVEISSEDGNEDMLAGEFSNFALGMTKEKKIF